MLVLVKDMYPADMNKPEDPPLGLIPIDSLYSPVKKFHIQ